MFTGIIQAIGRVARLEPQASTSGLRKYEDVRLVISDAASLGLNSINVGDSIAVNGVCLTVVAHEPQGFAADVSRESLDITNLGHLTAGQRVNLEKALTLATPLGGHLVSGHVDGLGTLVQRQTDGRSLRLKFTLPKKLLRYVAPKGSICVDGVSLTVNYVDQDSFTLNIVPHTLQATIIDEYHEGRLVNLEVDLIARYLERLLLDDKIGGGGVSHSSTDYPPAVIDEGFLVQHGFMP